MDMNEIEIDQIRIDAPLINKEAIEAIYDPYMIPPNIELCKKHQEATKVAVSSELYLKLTNQMVLPKAEELCPCCGLPTNKHRLKLCIEKEKLFFLGPGFPLFFQFIVLGIFLLFTIFLLSGIFNLVTNLKLDDSPSGSLNLWIRLSLLSKIDNKEYELGQEINNLITVIFCILFLQYFRYKQRNEAYICDENLISASDFTIEARNFPSNAGYHEIKEFFENCLKNIGFNSDAESKVIKINRTFFINDIYEIQEKQISLRKKNEELKKFTEIALKNEKILKKKNDKEQEIKLLKEKIERSQNNLQENRNFTGTVFVTFQNQAQSKAIQKLFKMGFCYKLFIRLKRCLCLNSYLLFKNQFIKVKRAPEPNDIIWKNIGISWWVKFKQQIVTSFFTGLVLIASFLMILGITYLQKFLKKHYEMSFIVDQLVNSLGAILIVLINQCLNFVIELFVNNEKHDTHTEHQCSLAKKKVWAVFMNTALIYILISWTFENFSGKNGLVDNLLYVILSNMVVNTLLQIFDSGYIIKIIERWRLRRNLKNTSMTQMEANNLYQDPSLNIALLFSSVMNIMFFSAFYAPLIPLSTILGIITLIIYYWTYKYLLLKRVCMPNLLSKRIAYEMIEYVEFVPLFLALGDIIFVTIFYEQTKFIDEIGLILCFINFIFPMKWVNKKLFPLRNKIKRFNDEMYKSYGSCFVGERQNAEDYDLFNPVTKNKAREARISGYLGTGSNFETRNFEDFNFVVEN